MNWDEYALTVAFDDNPFYRDDGVEHLVAWTHWDAGSVPLLTAEGIGIGDTYDALLDAYGSRVVDPAQPDECVGEWYTMLNDPSPAAFVVVFLDGPPQPNADIIGMRAGAGEGC